MSGLRIEPARPGARGFGLVLLALAIGALLLALGCGSNGCRPAALGALIGAGEPIDHTLVFTLRAPRAASGFAVGGLLALAGALLQVLLRNPLADPYVLGVSGGGAFGAVAAMWAGLGALAIGIAAWAGAALSIVALFVLGRPRAVILDRANAGSVRLLLSGVMLASGWSALISLALSLAPETRLRGMLFWLIGEIDAAQPWWPAMIALATCLAIAMRFARQLNVMLLGDMRAFSLGIETGRLRARICLLAALAAAFAVTTAGALGFVGLLVPHLVRRFTGNDQRRLLPASVLAGGTLVVLADTLARVVVAPTQLPVGAIMSLIGVPVFLFVLSRTRMLL